MIGRSVMSHKGTRLDRDETKPNFVVIASYVPLLPHDLAGVYSLRDSGLETLREELRHCPSGVADDLLWVAEDGGVMPVFVMPRGPAIADHLREWCGREPAKKFALCLAEGGDGPGVVLLFPNVLHGLPNGLVGPAEEGSPLDVERCSLVVRPIAFPCVANFAAGRLRKLVRNPTHVGFLDSEDFGERKRSDLSRVRKVGPFPVCWDNRPFGFDITSLVGAI